MHEIAYFCRDNPQGLQEDQGDEKVRLLRHPKIDSNYFAELIEAWPAWKDTISEQAVYRAYFAAPNIDIGIDYWRSLIEAAKGRPLFQECRTSGRIHAIKQHLNGLHLYLWRNPWDQWWSYKINSYFNTVNQLIVNADNASAPIKIMLNALGLAQYEQDDLGGAFGFYGERPLTSEQSYLLFYMLWCLALKEAVASADLLVNIDRLSDSAEYQHDICAKMHAMKIDGIDFSDCQVPQGIYSGNTKAFFAAAEARVHFWLIEGGWRPQDLDEIQSLRKQYEPLTWAEPLSKYDALRLIEQADRSQEMARRFETSSAEHAANVLRTREETKLAEARAQEASMRESQIQNQLTLALTTVQQAHELAQQAETRTAQAEASEVHAQAHARQVECTLSVLEQELDVARHELNEVRQANHHHWQLATQQQHQLNALYASRSWRVTAPLRWPVNQCRLLREQGIKKRIKALVKKILRKLNQFLLARPRLRQRLLCLSQRLGAYSRLKWLRDRLRGDSGARHSSTIATISSEEVFKQMTPHAQRIYASLKQAAERQKSGGK